MENLAKNLSKELLTQLGNDVVANYEADIQSRVEWEQQASRFFKLFAGYRQPKNTPWTNCSNIHVPLVGISSLQFQARAYDALIPSREIVKCYATDGRFIDASERASRYMNYQLTYEMEEWEEDMDAMLLALPIFGSCVKKTYYDHILQRPVSKFFNVDEFVAPYRCRRLEDAPRKTHMFHMPLNDIKIRAKTGLFIREAFDLPSDTTAVNEQTPSYNDIVNRITGQTETTSVSPDVRFLLEQHLLYDLDKDGIAEPYIVTVDYKTRMVLSIQRRWIQDVWNPDVSKPIEFFTAYTFIPNPVSWMGFGFGHFLEGLNESANTIINQLIDAGHLSNVGGKSGLISKRSGLRKANVDIKLGQFNEVDIATDDIRKAIYTYEFREPSPALFSLLGLITNYAKEVTSVSDSLLGKLPPSDTTATSMLAVMEQGMKVFSTIHKRLHRSLRKELAKIFFINSIYLKENIYFAVQDATSQEMKTYQSGRMDFNSTIDVVPVSDPNISSRAEKLIKARTVYEIAMQNPLLSGNPQTMYEITRQLLQANEVKNIDTILKPPPPPPKPPDFTPQEEHAEFLQEKFVEPLIHQNHFKHLSEHLIFKDSIWYNQLTQQGKKLLDEHIMKTKAFAYLQQQQIDAEEQAMVTPGITTSITGGMVTPPNENANVNPTGLEGLETELTNQTTTTGIAGDEEWVDTGLPEVV